MKIYLQIIIIYKDFILSPTRELAIQITEEANEVKRGKDINILAAYGGKDIGSQLKKLKRNIHLIIATPGRLIRPYKERNYRS